jgi:uncharacterized protein
MTKNKHSILRIYGFALIVSALLIAFVGFREGIQPLITVLILAVLEVTFSFENAIINAKILQKMSRGWQTLFMTVGIFIAVFVVRFLLPILIVAMATATGFKDVVQLALHDPEVYAHKLELAQPVIAAFGGMFLYMIFADFILQNKHVRWLKALESKLEKVGKVENASVASALVLLLGTVALLAPHDDQHKVLLAGIVGLVVYLLINAIDSIVSYNKMAASTSVASSTFKVGLVGFLYLELIDASFSLDGVIGAFAITSSVLLIAVGLGIGALFVRAMTIHVLRRGVLAKYKYLDHGAHYAIGILAMVMLVSIKYEVPHYFTGGIGLVVIGIALWQSVRESKRDNSDLHIKDVV